MSPRDRPVVRADDSAFAEGRGCYTTARVRAGRPRFAERHGHRLARGARALGLGEVDPAQATRALEELAAAAFPGVDGIVRLQASRDGAGQLHLVGVPRALGERAASWAAIVAPIVHPGAALPGGIKLTSRLALSLATDAAREAGAHEALMLDASRHLVEGASTNVFVVGRDGVLATPPVSRGAVAGMARQILCERVPEIVERDVSEAELFDACEIIAANAVRGAPPVVTLDGRPVGDGLPGPWSQRLDAALDAD